MAYKHVIRAKTKNLFDVNSEWEGVIASLTDVNLSIEGNTISGTDLGEGASSIISPTKIPISTNKVYYTSGQCSGDPTILVRLTDESGEVLTTGIAETYYPYNQYYKAFIVYLNNTFSITNDNAKYLQLGLRFAKGASTSTRVTFTNIQVELGSTPTPYTPYNYLQSNKRMIKVSDVCQLLDKSKYNLPHTESGLTFTAGTDGSIIVNGTCTSTVWANISSFELNPEHTFILIGCPGTNVNDVALYTADVVTLATRQWEEGRGSLVTGNQYKNKNNYLMIRILAGYVCNNLTFKPQLYDLTEMFGAGHEPATVAEFRQRFPNEYYPYSPQCWLTSYKSAVVCKTKNLFDVNNAVPYTFSNDNPPSNRISLKDGIYTTTYNNYNVGSGLRIKDGLVLSPGTYTLSLSVITVGETTPITGLTYGFRLYKSDGTKPVITTYTEKFNSRCSHTFTIPGDCTDIRLYLAPYCNSGQEYVYISLKDIQLEQGSTATSYVPYQHL